MSTNTNFDKRLNLLIDVYGISENELAKKTGLSQQAVNRLRNGLGTDPKASTLKVFAEFFNVTIGQMLGEEPLPSKLNPKNALETKRFVEIPIISWQQAENYKKIVASLDRYNWADWLHTDERIESANAFALELTSSSVEPLFSRGSRITIEPGVVAEPDDFIVFKTKTNGASIGKLMTSGDALFIRNLACRDNDLFIDNPESDIIIGVVLGGTIKSYSKERPIRK